MHNLKTVFALLVFGSSISFTQNTGKIAGVVTDAATGEPVIGATVVVDGTRLGAATDTDGRYVILKIPSGTHTLVVSCIGYVKTTVQNVKVLNDLTTTIDVTLTQTAVALSQEIVVVAESPMLKKDLTATESRITAENIKNLPVQNINQLIAQQAGVSRDAGGGIHIRGGRSSEVVYLLNGISITDDFNRTQALQIETESIQELQVISGTFNAEYGNAMSGVVNVVTKTGGTEFHSEVEAWTGDYVSTHKGLFWAIDHLSPIANYNLSLTLSGPVISDKMTFFVAGRRVHNDGYLYGKNQYSPFGRHIQGDGAYISMNGNDRWSAQGTLDWQLSGSMKIKIDGFLSKETSRYYNHLFKLNPLGDKGGKSFGATGVLKVTHQLSTSTFQELTVAYKYNEYISRLYDDPYDPRYVHPDSLNVPGYHFYTAGTNMNRFQRNTKSAIARWDLTSQINQYNLIKTGVEVQSDIVFYENINLVAAKNASGQDIVPFVPMIQGIESSNHDRFERRPFKTAAYLQDKLEFQSFIINVGLRFELFDPRGKVPVDKEDPNIYNPYKLEHIYKDLDGDGEIGLLEQVESNKYTLEEREKFWYKSTTIKTLLSPRLGISYPITDKGIIRFSYGIFQQIPEYSLLYLGDQYKLTSAQGIQGPFGNNDLKPQRTTIYEIGLQQQIFDEYAVDITGFYRDIRDWISSSQPIQTFLAGISYSQRINRDFANVRGVTLSLNKRYSNNYSFEIDYTHQIAEGTNSSPDEEFYSQVNGSEPTKILTPLSWDQTHTFNATMFVGTSELGASMVGSFHSGQPYTPTMIQGAYTGKDVKAGLTENSMRKPYIVNVDLEIFRNIILSKTTTLKLFIKIFNLFDTKNALNVYGDTGRPDLTREEKTVQGYDPGWFVNPSFYTEPRSVYIGTKLSF